MKKIILFVFGVCVFALGAYAQQSKWIGGGFSYSSTDDGGDKTTSSFGFSPEIGFVLNDKWAIGGGLYFGTANDTPNTISETNTSKFGIIPFARYYVAQTGKFTFFAQAELPYQTNKVETKTTVGGGTVTTNVEYKSIGLNVSPGVSYDLNDRFALELKMPSILSYYSNSGDYKNSGFSFVLNDGMSIQRYLLNPEFKFVYKF